MIQEKSTVVCDWSALVDQSGKLDIAYYIDSISCSSDGLLIASAGYGHLYVFHTQKGDLVHHVKFGLEQEKTKNEISFSPDNKLIIICGHFYGVRIYNIKEQPSLIKTLLDHTATVHDVKFSPCGQFIASASQDCSIIISNNQYQAVIQIPQYDEVYSINYSFNGDFLMASSGESVIIYRPRNNYKTHKTWKFSKTKPWITIHPKNTLVAVMMEKTNLCDMKSGKKIRIQQNDIDHNQMAFSPNGQEFAILVLNDQIDGESQCFLRVISISSFKQTLNIRAPHVSYALAFSCDGRYIVEGDNQMTVHDISQHRII